MDSTIAGVVYTVKHWAGEHIRELEDFLKGHPNRLPEPVNDEPVPIKVSPISDEIDSLSGQLAAALERISDLEDKLEAADALQETTRAVSSENYAKLTDEMAKSAALQVELDADKATLDETTEGRDKALQALADAAVAKKDAA